MTEFLYFVAWTWIVGMLCGLICFRKGKEIGRQEALND